MKRSILLDSVQDPVLRKVFEEIYDTAIDAREAASIARSAFAISGGSGGADNPPPLEPPPDGNVGRLEQ